MLKLAVLWAGAARHRQAVTLRKHRKAHYHQQAGKRAKIRGGQQASEEPRKLEQRLAKAQSILCGAAFAGEILPLAQAQLQLAVDSCLSESADGGQVPAQGQYQDRSPLPTLPVCLEVQGRAIESPTRLQSRLSRSKPHPGDRLKSCLPMSPLVRADRTGCY